MKTQCIPAPAPKHTPARSNSHPHTQRDSSWGDAAGTTIDFWSSVECDSLDAFRLNVSTAHNTSNTTTTSYNGYCENCRAASSGSIVTAVIGAGTQAIQLIHTLHRSSATRDLNRIKLSGVVIGFCGFVCTLASLTMFRFTCLNSDLGTLREGLGFICITVAKPRDDG